MKQRTTVLALLGGLAAGFISRALQQYGPSGAAVNLLVVTEEHTEPPPFECMSVSVAPGVPDPEWPEDTSCFGGLIQRETHRMPSGTRMIDLNLLAPCAEIVTTLTPRFRVDLASRELFRPVVAYLDEPMWVFQQEEAIAQISAYSGKAYLAQN